MWQFIGHVSATIAVQFQPDSQAKNSGNLEPSKGAEKNLMPSPMYNNCCSFPRVYWLCHKAHLCNFRCSYDNSKKCYRVACTHNQWEMICKKIGGKKSLFCRNKNP